MSWLGAAALSACATSALQLAPERADRPWTPRTQADGAIVAAPAAADAPVATTHVLPAQPALAVVPSAPPGWDATHAYTLAELIDFAESHDPDTRVAWNAARSAALAVGIARSAYLPSLSASLVGGYQTGHDRNSAGGVSVANDTEATGSISALSLQWLLFDFGERTALLGAAAQTALVSDIAFTAAHQQLIYKVSLAFYAHAAAAARVQTAADSLKNAEQIEAAAEERLQHGIGTVVELAQAHQATAQARLAQVQAQGGAEDARLALLAAAGISPLATLRTVDVSQRALGASLSAPVEQIVSDALARRPDVLGAYAAKQASLAAIRAAEAEFLPKLFFSATGAYTTSGLDVTAIPSVGQQQATVDVAGNQLGGTFLLGINIPIYDGGRRRALLGQAQAQADSAGAVLEKIRDEAVRQVVQAGNAVKTSLAAHDAATALATAAQTTFDAALAAYQHDVGSITAVSAAEIQLLQARNAASDAHSAALSAAASLALAAGNLGAPPAP